MSWPLASFALVALVLVAGWVAYERRAPSPRMIAVVAVMAALAALGRDAFAALPDVKPITAMTFVVGYALGPVPGFTVGALGMLVSNFLLGQGPYTPWQMAAWGFVGLGGALAALLTRRRLGRLGLASGCAATALMAKETMNVYTWSIGASHTPAALLAVAGQALAFDITDVVSSFLFGFAFAPELARILARVRVRMEVVWEGEEPGLPGTPARGRRRAYAWASAVAGAGALATASVVLLEGGGPARAGAAVTASRQGAGAVEREISYLAGAQNADGGFGASPGTSSTELYGAWVAIGLAAVHRSPQSLTRGGHSVLDSLRAQASSISGVGDLERTILALYACGVSVRSLPGAGGPGAGAAGGDPLALLLHARNPDGSFQHLANLTAFAVFALRAAGYAPTSTQVRSAGRWLQAQQDADGGFSFGARGGFSDVDDTAAVVQALVDARLRGPVLARATRYLVHAQNLDGGYPQQRGGASNAQSTAWAVQGLAAAGLDANRVTRAGSRSPLSYLRSLVTPEGSVRYSRTGAQTPVWVTAQALTAFAQAPMPIAPVRP